MKWNMSSKSNYNLDTPIGHFNLWVLVWPLLLENTLKYFITTVNTLILSRYSDDAVAAVGVAGAIINMFVVAQYALNAGVMVNLSQNLGAGKKDRANDLGSMAILLELIISVVLIAVILPLARPILVLMGLEEHLMDDGVAYLSIVTVFSIFEAMISVIAAIVRCYGSTQIPMISVILLNALNAIGSYIVVFRPVKTPFEGVAGVACARGVASVIAFGILLVMMRKVPFRFALKALRRERKPLYNMGMLLKIGVPSGLSGFSYNLSMTVATGIVARMGSAAISSMVYVRNIVQYIPTWSQSIVGAYQIMIGNAVGQGENNRAMNFGKTSIVICIIGNMILTLITVAARIPLIRLFTESQEIVLLAANIMLIDIFVELFRSMNHGAGNILSATGDVRYFMVIGILGCWLFTIVFSYLLGIAFHMGIYGCWLAFCLDEGFRATCYVSRWLSGKWQKCGLVKS